MRMNPPRGMGGMGPQVSDTKSSTKDCVDNVVTVYGVLQLHQCTALPLCSCHTDRFGFSEQSQLLVTLH